MQSCVLRARLDPVIAPKPLPPPCCLQKEGCGAVQWQVSGAGWLSISTAADSALSLCGWGGCCLGGWPGWRPVVGEGSGPRTLRLGRCGPVEQPRFPRGQLWLGLWWATYPVSLRQAGPSRHLLCWPGRTTQAGEGLLSEQIAARLFRGLKLIKELFLAFISCYLPAIYMLMQACLPE